MRLLNRQTSLYSVIAAWVVVIVAMVHWGGSATTGPLLALGVALLVGEMIGFGFLAWWLLLSPLPANQQVSSTPPSERVRALLAGLLVIGGMFFQVGAFWDEVWHRTFGAAAFGNDFWWPPHQLIYLNIGLINVLALGGLFMIMRGQGSMRQRFRRNPLIGLLALASGFMVVNAPVDPIWHQIYGLDITAWSLPHMILILGFMVIMLVTVALQLSLVAKHGWQTLRGIHFQEILALFTLCWVNMALLQFGVSEWDGVTSVTRQSGTFGMRPEWLYPVVLLMIATFSGTFALHVTRRVGSATLVGVLTVALRLLLIQIFDADAVRMTATSHMLLLPPLIALDIWYALRLRRADSTRTVIGGSLVAALGMLVIGLPLIAQHLVYPRINAETLLPMLLVGLMMALLTGWSAARLGAWLGAFQRTTVTVSPVIQRRAAWIGAGALLAALLFLTVFIRIAPPPNLG